MSTAGGSKDEQGSPKERPAFANYNAAVKGLLEWVEATEQQLTDWELELTLNGCWKEWSNRQSVGTFFEFSTVMFLECDDELVGNGKLSWPARG